MNLGQAVAVCLYELARNPAAARRAPSAKHGAVAGDVERLTELFIALLQTSGYVHARVAGSTELKIRRLMRRMNLSAHDAEIWLGIARQLRWKLDECYSESK